MSQLFISNQYLGWGNITYEFFIAWSQQDNPEPDKNYWDSWCMYCAM